MFILRSLHFHLQTFTGISENSRYYTRPYLLSTAEQTLGVGMPSPRLKLQIEVTENDGLFESTETNYICEGTLSNSTCDGCTVWLTESVKSIMHEFK
jgi:hypothetical protein